MGSKDTKIENVMKVCRLCLGNNNLISIFDDRIRIPDNMIDVIQVTTGVTISPSDNVSQKLCNKCLHITIKMFKFRSSSTVNDMELKARAARKLKPDLHKSVDILLSKYPTIILPSSITKCNISPVVMVNSKEMCDWLENYKITKKAKNTIKESMKVVADILIKSKMPEEAVDLENRIMPYLIPNKEIISRPQPHQATGADLQQLPTTMQRLSPVMPELTVAIGEKQTLTHKELVPINPDNTVSESIMTTNIQGNKIKRKLSVSPTLDKSKKLKSHTDSVEKENSVDSLVTLKYVTKSLLICDICNGILYSAKDLKKHKMNHMRCHLCKKCFRSLEETKEHSESGCIIKKIMSNLPTIKLKRCDQSEQFRDQYPFLFSDSDKTIERVEICSFASAESPTNYYEESAKDPLEVEISKVKQAAPSPNFESETEPVVEILLISDDENEDRMVTKKDNVNQIPCKVGKDKSITISSKNEINNPVNNKSTLPILNKSIEIKTSKIPTGISASVKPDIEIIGDNMLDVNLDDSDINLLKNIIKKTKKHLKETSVQTDMPRNADIIPSLSRDKLFELMNLKKYLNFYKIPVNISYAPQYSVRYGFEPSPLLRKDRSWSKVIAKVTTPSRTPPVSDISQTKTLHHIISNNNPNQEPSNSSSIEKPNTPNHSMSGIPSKTVQQPITENSLKVSTCNTIFTTKPSILPQTIDIASKTAPSIATNKNSCSENEISVKTLHNFRIKKKTINCKLLNNSVMSQVLTNITSQQSNNNHITLNNTNFNNATKAPAMKNNLQTAPNLRPLTGTNNISTIPGLNSISPLKKVLISPRTGTLIINPTITTSEVSVPAPSQNEGAPHSSSTITTNSEISTGSNFVPTIRVKDVSELR